VWGDDVSPSVTYFQRLNPSYRCHEIRYRSFPEGLSSVAVGGVTVVLT